VSGATVGMGTESDGREMAETGIVGGEAAEGQAEPENAVVACSRNPLRQELPEHKFRARDRILRERRAQIAPHSDWNQDPNIWLYRKKTAALLQRYMRWSLDAGRVPSLLGRELFRARMTAYTATTFEARVIFLHDVERCLDRLGSFDREIIARVVLQEHDNRQAARILHCTSRTIERRLAEVLDGLSEAFLKAQLIAPLPETKEEKGTP
jgi:DNA-directed RNA polymerase specialized sigma24 family protein